jgi:hypothetical protein
MKMIVLADINFRREREKTITEWFPHIEDGTLNSGTITERVGFWLQRPLTGMEGRERVEGAIKQILQLSVYKKHSVKRFFLSVIDRGVARILLHEVFREYQTGGLLRKITTIGVKLGLA